MLSKLVMYPSFDNFYFEIIKKILDRSIEHYSRREEMSILKIDEEITQHIEATSREHWNNADPNIDYDKPLCRLGYLFTHAGAQATLFERTIRLSEHLQALLKLKAQDNINICTVGGGPGTELLGLTKYLLTTQITLCEITFTVLDGVPKWGETWDHLANESRDAFRKNISAPPLIHKSFLSNECC